MPKTNIKKFDLCSKNSELVLLNNSYLNRELRNACKVKKYKVELQFLQKFTVLKPEL